MRKKNNQNLSGRPAFFSVTQRLVLPQVPQAMFERHTISIEELHRKFPYTIEEYPRGDLHIIYPTSTNGEETAEAHVGLWNINISPTYLPWALSVLLNTNENPTTRLYVPVESPKIYPAMPQCSPSHLFAIIKTKYFPALLNGTIQGNINNPVARFLLYPDGTFELLVARTHDQKRTLARYEEQPTEIRQHSRPFIIEPSYLQSNQPYLLAQAAVAPPRYPARLFIAPPAYSAETRPEATNNTSSHHGVR
jgi:hypothetical protein